MNYKGCLGKGIKIAIIDSGIDTEREEFQNVSITKLNVCNDRIGHGTAVTAILSHLAKESIFYCYNLFDQNGVVDTRELIEVLDYITATEHYDIIHLSCGVMAYDLEALYIKCKEITDSGTIIVSAFDNQGIISYPAAFDNVIGVDWSKFCSDGTKYFYVENSPINILGIGALQKLPWANGCYKYVAGASFAAPYISGIIAKMLESGIPSSEIVSCLKDNAQKILKIDNEQYHPIKQELNISKAVLLPFNKEIQTLSAFEDMLEFQVENYYDFLPFRNVGKTCSSITKLGDSERRIHSFSEIDWNSDFDTVILGHVDVVSDALKKDILKDILELCISFKKNLYAFDDLRPYAKLTERLEELGCFAFFPKVELCEVDKRMMGKMHEVSTPILAIFGTSSKQGKFSLQLMLRKKFKEIGYNVGALGTEPASLLFGMDRVYPMGYGRVGLSGQDNIEVINRYMHEIDVKHYDLIITGSQSLTVPLNTGNIAHYPLAQHEFFTAVSPDGVVLCVNPFDESEYVQRTVNYLNNYMYSKVIALVMIPRMRSMDWAIQGTQSEELAEDILKQRCAFYRDLVGVPCFVSDSGQNVEELVQCIIDFFSE